MFKSMMLVALAAVSVAAMAQDFDRHEKWQSADANGKSIWDIRREVGKQETYLSGGDKYAFEVALLRMQPNAENALISGLFAAHRQAVIVRHEMVVAAVQSLDATADIAADPEATAVIAEETESSLRPMRMKMQPKETRDMDYNTAFDVLTCDLNDTQKGQLLDWWNDDTNTLAKDAVVRMLKNDCKVADDPIYASFYPRHYDWVTTP